MRVGVTGATGFVGRAVVSALLRRENDVVALTRNPSTAHMPAAVRVVKFDVNGPAPNPEAIDGLDAIVHLAGEIVDGRWTSAKKRAIFSSRVDGTRNLVASLASCDRRPRVLVSASAIGYFGDRGDEPLDESSEPGNDFLANVCIGWEREAQAAAKLGMRVASVRVSMVLGPGGALGKLLPIFRAGIGGPMGSGRQWIPWIHRDDIADLFCFAVERDEISGPVCAVAPDYSSNRRFAQAVGSAIGRPALAPAPGFALKLIVGEFAETLLGGQLIIPAKAADAGFVWKHPTLEETLIDLLAPSSNRVPAVQHFTSEQMVGAPREKVFAFLASAANLSRLAPPAMQLKLDSPDQPGPRRGWTVDYSLRVRGLPVKWRAMISEWSPPVRFSDIQVRGPYLFWRHTHELEESGDGTMVIDRISYALPFAPLSSIALPAVRGELERAFAYRRHAMLEAFGG